MTEVRLHPDHQRIALRMPETIDDLQKGDTDWIEVTPPCGHHMLRVDLLTEAEVADWTPLVPQVAP